MIRKAKGEIQPITVRHAEIIDQDKVRYRVYRSPTEYIAVIAENALMAMKLSGVDQPYKVMRDLFHEGMQVEAARMRESEDGPNIAIRLTPQSPEDKKDTIGNFAVVNLDQPFTPLMLNELKQPRVSDEHIVPASELMAHITIDPIAYAMATRSDEALKMLNADMPMPVSEAPAAAELPEEPALAMETAPAEVPAPEITAAPAHNPDEALPLDEIARLLAEPRS